MRQRADQTAADFRAAIIKQTRKYGTAYSDEDIIEVFLSGIDKRLKSVTHQWATYKEEINRDAKDEVDMHRQLQRAFTKLVRFADAQRTWETDDPQGKQGRHRRRNSTQTDDAANSTHAQTVSALTNKTPKQNNHLIKKPPTRDQQQRLQQFPACPTSVFGFFNNDIRIT